MSDLTPIGTALQDSLQTYKLNEIVTDVNALRRTGWTIEDSFTDFTTQLGSPIDTPKVVKYGNAKTSPSGIVSVDANGIFTFNKTAALFAKSRIRAGRSGASGYSSIFFWAETSIDNGATWQVFGNSIDVHLNNAQESELFFDISAVVFPAGLKFRSMFARSSTGDDSGDLMTSTPSAALQAYGVPIAPSAQISIYRSTTYPY